MNYKHLFGPVPSRRLGRSLGVDLIPYKTCSLNCVYCECGLTTDLIIERKEFFPTSEVIDELNHYLSDEPRLDYITYSGSGEPTLSLSIGEITTFLRKHYSDYNIALLTNGTLFYNEDLLQEIKDIDLVIPSLDAATEEAFVAVNQPNEDLSIEKYIEGLKKFSKIRTGRMWLEIFIVPGLNDNEKELTKLALLAEELKPDKVQINSLDRPAPLNWVKEATIEKLNWIQSFFKKSEIISRQFLKASSNYDPHQKDAVALISETIKRRPSTAHDLSLLLNMHINEVNKYVNPLLEQQIIKYKGSFFIWNSDR